MSAKVVSSTQNWLNVSNALKSFKTDDKTLTKIAKFTPNSIKLIAAFFLDVANRALTFFGARPNIFVIGNRQDISQDTTEKATVVKKAKSIWTNHKGKILLGLAGVGILGLGSYLFFTKNITSLGKKLSELNLSTYEKMTKFSEEKVAAKQETFSKEFIDENKAAINEESCECDMRLGSRHHTYKERILRDIPYLLQNRF